MNETFRLTASAGTMVEATVVSDYKSNADFSVVFVSLFVFGVSLYHLTMSCLCEICKLGAKTSCIHPDTTKI